MHRLVLIGLASPVVTLQPARVGPHDLGLKKSVNANMGRRALFVGAAAAFTACVQPANALTSNELEDVMTRAKNNQLSTDGVIFRAMNDDLIKADEIIGCKSLEEIYKIDTRAAQEVRIANDVLLKLSAAEKEKGGWRSTLPSRVNPASIEDAYEIGRIIEQRISSRASSINVKITLDCQADPAAAYKDGKYRGTSSSKMSDSSYRTDDRSSRTSDSSYRYTDGFDYRSTDKKGIFD